MEPYEKPVEEFGSEPLTDGGGSGISVSAAGTVYVADVIDDKVDIFTEGETPPIPTTLPVQAGEVMGSSASLHGTLVTKRPGKSSNTSSNTTWERAAQGGKKAPEPAGESEGGEVSQEVTELEPNVQYTVCSSRKTCSIRPPGRPCRSKRSANNPALEEENTVVLPSGTELKATINPNNQETTCQFQYVEDALYKAGSPNPYSAGVTAPCEFLGYFKRSTPTASGYGEKGAMGLAKQLTRA